MKIQAYSKKTRRGLVTVINTVVISGFCLALMAMAFRASIRSLEAQKKVQLQIDYEQREQAFLRAVVGLAPAYAANTMMSGANANAANTSFNSLFTEAGGYAKMDTALSPAVRAALVAADPELGAPITANTGDTARSTTASYVAGNVGGIAGRMQSYTAPGTAVGGTYPVQMATLGAANANATMDYPILSSDYRYGVLSGGLGSADYYSDTVLYPDIHFGYANPGQPFIARHHWWQMYLHAQSQDAAVTGVGNLATTSKEYIVSLYEIPAQLAISSAAFTNLGNNIDVDWDSEVSVTGRVFAQSANIAAGSNLAGLSTTEGVSAFNGGSVGATGNQVDSTAAAEATAREVYEATNAGTYYPISKSSDYARSMFLPINPGIDFFDRFADEASVAASNGRLSAEDWFQYSRGCQQCVMKLDIVDTNGVGDQTPTDMDFTYSTAGGRTRTINFSSAVPTPAGFEPLDPVTFADNYAAQGLELPFEVARTNDNRPGVHVYLDRLVAYLMHVEGEGAFTLFSRNHSLVVNPDYNALNGNVLKPGFPSNVGDIGLVLKGCNDLTAFPNGFSLVTNLRLYLNENLNQVGYAAGTFPPLSIFAPEQRFGSTSALRYVRLNGSLGSLSQSGAGVDIANIRAIGNNAATAGQLSANLKPIGSLAELPPVNMMNWLVVVSKKR